MSVFLSPLYIKLACLLNRLTALLPAILEGQEACPHANHSELGSYTPSTASNPTSPGKPSPHWFFPFPLNGNYKAISSPTGQKQDGTKQNTHRSLTTGQLFVLTEMATSGSRGRHFPGQGHQLSWGQLRGLLGVSNKKPERSIFHQILLSPSGVSGLSFLLKDPLLASGDMKLAHLFHPHGTWTDAGGAFTLISIPYPLLTPTDHNGKINAGQQADSYSQPQKFPRYAL